MNHDGFHTTCTTCDARLRVRDESAIGQIFACPKCGSMVLVAAPEGFESPHDHAAQQAEQHAATTDASIQSIAAVNSAHGGWLPLVAASLTGLVMLAGGGHFAWHTWSDARHGGALEVADQADTPSSDTPSSDTPSSDTLSSDAPSSDTPSSDTPSSDTLSSDADPSDSETEATRQRHAPETSTAPAPLVAVENPQLDQQHPVLVPPADEPLDLPATKSEDIFAEADAIEAVTNPPSLLESELPPVAQSEAFNSDTVSRDRPPNPASLSSLARLLSGTSDSSSAQTEVHEPTAEEPREVTGTLATKMSSGLEGQRAELTAKLQVRLRAVRFDQVPLVDFVRAMMQLSGVPIQIDPDALEQSRHTATTPVSVAAIETTVFEALRVALEPLRMKPVTGPQVVRIVSSRLENASNVQTSFYVGDLLAGRGEDLDLAHLVATLIEPDSWEVHGGAGRIEVKADRLVVSNSRLAAIRTLLVLEKLRAARGLRHRKRVPQRLVSLQPKWGQLHRSLLRPISMNAWQEWQLAVVIADLESASGLRVLVDWASLGRQGVTPQTRTTLVARETPASDVLHRLTAALDLGLIPIDGKTVQLCSKDALAKRRYIEFYSFDELGADGMDHVEQLMLQGLAALDPASETAIVVCDANLHRALIR